MERQLSEPSRRQRVCQLWLAVAASERGHHLVIVDDMAERDLPGTIGQLEDRIARVRRAGLDDVRERMLVTEARAADAAGIDDQPSVAKSHGTGEMGVGAQDQRLRDTLRKLLDAIERR